MQKILNFEIESYNYHHKKNEPIMIKYEEKIFIDENELFCSLIEKIVNKYIIKSKENIADIYYYITNIADLFWKEYFKDDFISKYIDYFSIAQYNVTIQKLNRQFHLCDKTIKLIICGPPIGGGVGEYQGIKLFFHTNEKDIHHKPHIHCQYSGEEFRIDLNTLLPLDKTFKSKKKTAIAIKMVAENKDQLLNYWNLVVINGEQLKLKLEF